MILWKLNIYFFFQNFRPQISLSSSAEVSRIDDRDKIVTDDSDVHERSRTQLSSELIFCAEKQWDTEASVQPCSFLGCVDKYLSKPEVNSSHSANSNSKQVDCVPQLSQIGSTEPIKNVEKLNDNEDFEEDEVGASLALAEQSEEDLQEKSTSHVKLVETGNQASIGKPSGDSLSETHAFKKLQCALPPAQVNADLCIMKSIVLEWKWIVIMRKGLIFCKYSC